MQSGTERRAALAFARSQGWLPPEELSRTPRPGECTALHSFAEGKIAELERQLSDCKGEWSPLAGELEKAEARLGDAEVALTAERESHAVTKAALLRARGKGAGARIAALEGALARLTGDDVTEADLAAAKALLK